MPSDTSLPLRRAVSQPAQTTVAVASANMTTSAGGTPCVEVEPMLGRVPPRIEPDPCVRDSASTCQSNATPKQDRNTPSTSVGSTISAPPSAARR